MKIQLKAVAAVLAGVGIGVTAMHGLQGGEAKPPPAFGIANGTSFAEPSSFVRLTPDYGEQAADLRR
jgi:hypothetical protein